MKETPPLEGKRALVIGAGNMGAAILMGLKRTSLSGLSFHEIDSARADAFALKSGLKKEASLPEALQAADIVVLAVKPQSWPDLAAQTRGRFRQGQLVITIMAGIRVASVAAAAGPAVDIIRAMPNTPALVGEGFTALAGERPECLVTARAVFAPLGALITVTEGELDAVTAVSGSGPAYVFAFIESFIQAAREQGFPPEVASGMVIQTLKGALKLLEESGETPEALRARVTSKGGTTEAALKEMESLGFSRILPAGIRAAVRRAGELGK